MSQNLQEKNKALLIEGFNILFNKRDFATAERYWSPNYIQHSAHIEPGRNGLFNLVRALPAGTTWEHGIIMAEGDFVMLHSRYANPDGSALIVMDIVKIKDGIFEEHWDVMQAEATNEESKSKLPMFGDKFPSITVSKNDSSMAVSFLAIAEQPR